MLACRGEYMHVYWKDVKVGCICRFQLFTLNISACKYSTASTLPAFIVHPIMHLCGQQIKYK